MDKVEDEAFFTCAKGKLYRWEAKLLPADGRRPAAVSINIEHSSGFYHKGLQSAIGHFHPRRVDTRARGMTVVVIDLHKDQDWEVFSGQVLSHVCRALNQEARVRRRVKRRGERIASSRRGAGARPPRPVILYR